MSSNARVTGGASPPVTAAPARTDWTLRALQNRAFGVLVFLALLSIFFSLLTTNFASVGNANTIILNASILVVVACAEAIVILTRNYDLSVGSIVALASFVGFDVIRSFPELGPVLILVPIAVGGACGVLNGWLVAYGRVPSVVATLGTLSIFRGLAFLYAGGDQVNPSELPDWVGASVGGQILGLSPLVVVAVIVVAAVALLLRHTRLGREIYAIGSNPEAAAYYGLSAPRIVFRAYVLCGLLTGVAAFLFGARVSYVVPYLAQGLELEVLAAVVIGGVSVLGGSGTVVGAAIGAVTIATLDNGLVLLGSSEFTRRFIQGSAIVVAVSVDAVIHRRIRTLLRTRRRRGMAS